MSELLYAVQPGSVTLRDGTVQTFTASQLATAYGIQAEPYLVVNTDADLPKDPFQRMKYLVLVPRADGQYQDIKYDAEDDGQDVAYRPDFDASKQYIDSTDPRHIYPDEETEEKLHDEASESI